MWVLSINIYHMEVKISFKKTSLFKNEECLCPPVPIFAASAMVEGGAFSGLDSACAASSGGPGTLHCTRARRQWCQGSSLDLGSRGLPGRLSEGRGPRAPRSHFSLRSRRGMCLHILVCFSQFLRVLRAGSLSGKVGCFSHCPGPVARSVGQCWEPHPFRLSLAVKLASGL